LHAQTYDEYALTVRLFANHVIVRFQRWKVLSFDRDRLTAWEDPRLRPEGVLNETDAVFVEWCVVLHEHRVVWCSIL